MVYHDFHGGAWCAPWFGMKSLDNQQVTMVVGLSSPMLGLPTMVISQGTSMICYRFDCWVSKVRSFTIRLSHVMVGSSTIINGYQ